MNTKVCSKCKRELPATVKYFHRDKRIRSGLRARCKECHRKYRKQWLKDNPDYNKQYWRSEKGKVILRRYSQSDRGRECRKKFNGSRKARKWWREFYYKNKLSCNVATTMRRSLKNNKNNQHWEIFVPYTLEELSLHLQGTIGLTTKVYLSEFWQNFYGVYYHIDHKKPKKFFGKKLEDPSSKEFQECWSLNNLQLLFWLDNLEKDVKLNWERNR